MATPQQQQGNPFGQYANAQMGLNNYYQQQSMPLGYQMGMGAVQNAAGGYGSQMGGAMGQLGAGLQNAGNAAQSNWQNEVSAAGSNPYNATLFSDPKYLGELRQANNEAQRSGQVQNQLLGGRLGAVNNSGLLQTLMGGGGQTGGAMGNSYSSPYSYVASNGQGNPIMAGSPAGYGISGTSGGQGYSYFGPTQGMSNTYAGVTQQPMVGGSQSSIPQTTQTNYYGPNA